MQRAEMLRESHLQERIRRAQEEEAKVSINLYMEDFCRHYYKFHVIYIETVCCLLIIGK